MIELMNKLSHTESMLILKPCQHKNIHSIFLLGNVMRGVMIDIFSNLINK